ncbi:biotin--[acetyl-CoA-carboxylase] ligase [Schaalia vaccimaxillae]|uniref:biotin--[acetyl-CoA-carboxylase] ligase n=1 Tax=Schaalia vaccimaxillae TaxID=183916 RepID=UPI00041DBCEB|nr:biotin--[acetyl-CoA-carboxylase] ligase [Schaalia vaccimaxillae]
MKAAQAFDTVSIPTSLTSPVIRVDSTSSTNDLAMELLADPRVATPHLTTVLAREQTQGRGRLNRTWESTPGRSLTASTIISIPSSLRQSPHGWFCHIGALAVRDAIAAFLEPLGREVSTKWPNDVLIDDSRKICGILATLAPSASPFVTTCILGYGVNVSMTPDERPTPTATSLSLEGIEEADHDPMSVISGLLAHILRGIDTRVRALVTADGKADISGLASEAASRCTTLGRSFRFAAPTDDSLDPLSASSTSARALDLDSNGCLLVQLSDGSQHPLSAGDIHVID